MTPPPAEEKVHAKKLMARVYGSLTGDPPSVVLGVLALLPLGLLAGVSGLALLRQGNFGWVNWIPLLVWGVFAWSCGEAYSGLAGASAEFKT